MIFKEIDFKKRLRLSISEAWSIFQQKVGNGLIDINKEASMQLHYAYILQNLLPLIIFQKNESIIINLEQTVKFEDNSSNEVDLILIGNDGNSEYKIAVEMKCYREIASSGNKRGAVDIFFKDVYVDLEILEKYLSNSKCNETVFLCMHDMKRLAYPDNKKSKYWDYGISNGFVLNGPKNIQTPIGGENQNITINNNYNFNWSNFGNFYFLEL